MLIIKCLIIVFTAQGKLLHWELCFYIGVGLLQLPKGQQPSRNAMIHCKIRDENLIYIFIYLKRDRAHE